MSSIGETHSVRPSDSDFSFKYYSIKIAFVCVDIKLFSGDNMCGQTAAWLYTHIVWSREK